MHHSCRLITPCSLPYLYHTSSFCPFYGSSVCVFVFFFLLHFAVMVRGITHLAIGNPTWVEKDWLLAGQLRYLSFRDQIRLGDQTLFFLKFKGFSSSKSCLLSTPNKNRTWEPSEPLLLLFHRCLLCHLHLHPKYYNDVFQPTMSVELPSIREQFIQLLVEKMSDSFHSKKDNCYLNSTYSMYRCKQGLQNHAFKCQGNL